MTLNIDEVAQDFAQWRSSRTKRTQTPPELIKQAVSLVEHYPKSIVVAKLGINSVTLKRWMNEDNNQEGASAFIEIENNPPRPVANSNDSLLELNVTAKMPCGTTFSFVADAPLLASIMTSFQSRTNR